MNKKHSSRRRNFAVFCTLVGILSLTSLVLLIVAPAPLAPGAAESLFAVDTPDTIDAIFTTRVPIGANRWRYIYVHQSRTAGGNSATLARPHDGLADHFVIGNGDGAADGEVQVGQRWDQQTSADPPTPHASIAPDCISICLIGNFNKTSPTPTQLRRLADLTNSLRSRLHIPLANILLATHSASAAGIGKYFPTSDFAARIALAPAISK